MKICLISSSFPRFPGDYWGAFVYELAQYLVQRKHQVYVITPLHPQSPESETRDGIVVRRFRYYGWQRGLVLAQQKGISVTMMGSYVVSAVRTACQMIKEQNLQIIHAYWIIPAGFIGILTKWLTDVPVVASVPGSDLNIWACRWFPRQLIRFTLSRLDGVFALGTVLGDA